MILNTTITPLQFNQGLDNQFNIDFAIKEGKKPPEKKWWDEIVYNAQSTELVGEIEVMVSSIEKMKSTCGHVFEIGKPVLVSVSLLPWAMDGKKGISCNILNVIKDKK